VDLVDRGVHTERAISQAMEQAARGQPHAAIAALRRLLQREPRSAVGWQALGQLLIQQGQVEQGLFAMGRGVETVPQSAAARNNLGVALLAAGRFPEAAAELHRSVELDPGYGLAWAGLCTALTHVKDLSAAAEAGRRAVELLPDLPDVRVNAALAILEAGRVEEAIADLRAATARFPGNAKIHSLLLMALNNSDRITPGELLAEHRRYGDLIRGPAPPSTAGSSGLSLRLDPERPLRVGFVSGDLATHSVMYFLEPLLERLGKRAPSQVEAFEIVCYSTGRSSDEATERARRLAHAWIDAAGLDDLALDRRIRADGIDVLVELGGHTATGRLPAVAAAPAPVIISGIGYPATTGLPAVGYRIVDSMTDPPEAGARGPLATERLIRLDPCFLCYRPPAGAPDPAASRGGRREFGAEAGIGAGGVGASRSGRVVFGSFNALPKVSPTCLDCWAAILAEVPGSGLLLKASGLDDAGARERLWTALESRGIGRDRVELMGATPTTAGHLAQYGRVDIALDTFPYNGTTTTCEALWMGVPVVGLAGDRHASRVGLSLLSAAGLGSLAAADVPSYIGLARSLAADEGRRAELRSGLRERLRGSALCDEPAYARRWAAAIRGAWRERCA
jgi:protein O-GlcNAc transferase